ncbi:MAG: cytochrome c biogenesis protein CcsA [Mediterranea sp.]|jgi:ABC-type transport system involved in cytochrome c biogenesis permease subunit|nr:cytochrome c biogenesis protein CcsA [Mediterranea sp.]
MIRLKLLTFSLLGLIIIVLISATVVEKLYGTGFAADHIYRSSGFITLWGLIAISALIYIIKLRLFGKKIVFLFHLSFLLILTGAFTTRIHGKQGLLHLRENETATAFVRSDGKTAQSLPFSIKLDRFRIEYYTGTPSPVDYVSTVTVTDGDNGTQQGEVAMNRIFSYKGYRFNQSGYDEDECGATLAVSYDPWGIGITYTGYALLLVSIMLFFLAPDTKYRSLLRRSFANGATLLLLLLHCPAGAYGTTRNQAPKALPQEVAGAFGDLYVLYNNRICPLQTVAKDFTTKLYGRPTYRGLTSEQVFTGWLFYYSSWKSQPMIRIKDKSVRTLLGIDGKYAALDDFTDRVNGYKLNDAINRIRRKGSGSAKRGMEEADEKYNIIRYMYSGKMLKIYPGRSAYDGASGLIWRSQGDDLPMDMDDNKWLFIKKTQDYIHEMVVKKDYDGILSALRKIRKYQEREAASLLPSDNRFKAEKLYNSLTYTFQLAVGCIAAGVLSFIYYCICMAAGKRARSQISVALAVLLLIVFAYLTVNISLRWFVSAHPPLSNGYETMQFMAWCALILAFILRKRALFPPFGFLICGFTLMVSTMGESNPQITHLIPVLSSPLLSLHVVAIMFSYALFAFIMLNGLAASAIYLSGNTLRMQQVEKLQTLSRLLLYPALFCLVTGIFVGAVWANVSWGRYWGWDPKEVWALITMLIYSFAVHTDSLPVFRKPMFFHLFTIIAFLSVLITYFGVNFILGGLHSYA